MWKVLLACAALLSAPAAFAADARTVRSIEEAAEASLLDITLESDVAGRILIRACDYCKVLTLRVDANTVVMRAGERASLRVALDRRAEGATVVYDPDKLVVKRIVLWN
jgi:hypothetical protein